MDDDDRVAVSRLALQQGQKNDGVGVGVIRTMVSVVVDDANDLALDFVYNDAVSECVSFGPVAVRHGLIDDCNLGSSVVIRGGEVAALLKLNSHCAKEIGAIEVRYYRFVFAFCGDVPGNAEVTRVAGSPVAHGQVRCQCRRGNARRVAQAIERIGEEDACTVVAVTGSRKVNDRGEGIGAIESNGAIEDVERGADKQAAAS